VRPPGLKETSEPDDLAKQLGLKPWTSASVSWDLFNAVLTPGDPILLVSWKDDSVARTYERSLAPNDKARVRQIRILRDYGKYDRREASQYYADTEGAKTVHT
jgi:hypothetical protein